jgi:glutamyl-tRNA(Gln) amidotransferase subunit D
MKTNAEAGDKVLVKTKTEELEGIYIKRPDLLDKNVFILKLNNGYNIGINEKDVKEIKVLKKYEKPISKVKKITNKKELPNILIMSTGGTISSKVDYKTGGVIAEYTAEDFVEMCPELKNIANVKAKNVMSIMSEDMNSSDWKKIAEEVHKEIENYDGVVVTQGTDALGYSAAALSFMLDVNKPVILTASQKSIDRGSSDAFFNLICSVNAASNWDGAEVVVCMHSKSDDESCSLIKGTKVRKLHTTRRDAFRCVNDLEFAKVYKDKIELVNENYEIRSDEKAKLDDGCSDEVALVYVHPGMSPKVFEIYENYKGIILMGTGLGNIPNNLYKAVKKLTDKGIFVGMTSQCLYGRTSSTVYSPLRKISLELNVVFLEDMLPETAFVKLGYVLAKEKDLEKIKELMLTNLKGEINHRIYFNSFLN